MYGVARAREPALASDVLATLLAVGYGPCLAETQGGGSSPRDRAPFVNGALHPDPTVREAAQVALVRFERTRAWASGGARRLDARGLRGAGLDDAELLLRRATLALQVGEQPAVARECAAELRRSAPLDNQPMTRDSLRECRADRSRCRHRVGRAGGCARGAGRGGAHARELGRERFDLRIEAQPQARGLQPAEPGVEREVELGVRGAVVEIAGLRSLVDVYRTLLLLAEDRDAADAGVLARAREADQWLLEAQRWA